MTTVVILLGLLLSITGLIGCILPIIPGLPLSYVALIILSFAKDWEPFGATFLIVTGLLTALMLLLDYLVPVVGAKKFGASKYGVWGSFIGMIIGLFIFPPFGLIVGGFIGAIAGELLAGKEGDDAIRAGIGVFLGNLFNIGLKLGISGFMLFFYIKEML
jgi:uncharacterized protein YqgC (DUF456 family)